MAELTDLRYKIKKYYKLTSFEIKGLAIAIISIAFAISFNDWGAKTFDPAVGLFNLFNALLITLLSILVHDSGLRIWGLAMGYRIEYKMWTYGIVISVVLAFITRGNFWLIVPGGFLLHHLAGERLGFFRYGINFLAQSMIALGGNLFTLVLIIVLKILNSISPNALLQKAIIFNVIYLITNMLPIPPLDGSKIFFGSRMIYMFVMPAIIAAAFLLIVDIPIIISLILSMLIGMILWIVYYINFEKKIWKGP